MKTKLLDKDTNFFGLDIGTTAIRCVQLKKDSQGAHKLVTYGEVGIEEKISKSESKQDREKVANTIKQLLKDARVSTSNVVAGLPSQKVFTSIISIPSVEEKELPEAIRYQADQYIPMPVEEAQLDWAVLNHDENQKKMDILLVATQKKNTEDLLYLLESINLDVQAIEPDAIASTRSLVGGASNSVVALMDVGANSSDLAVAYKRSPWVMRNAPVGGNTLIKVASQNLNVDFEQAGQFVRKFGMTKTKLEGQVYNALKPSVDSVVEEVSKSIQFFNSRYRNEQVEKVVLTGGVSGWPDFPVYIADSLNLPVEIGNSWINVSYPANQQNALMDISTRFAVASGLAQR